MKRSTIITIAAFALGIIVLAAGFILLTDNNISDKLFPEKTTTTTTTTTTTGKPRPTDEPMDFASEDMTKYITLGAYTGLQVAVDQLEVDAASIEQMLVAMLYTDRKGVALESGNIAELNVFNFSFTGVRKDNGEVFQPTSSTDAFIQGDVLYTISSKGSIGTFIDGFAQGILGKAVDAAQFVLDITFPEDYHEKTLAGVQTQFTIKINSVQKVELTDELAKEYSNGEYTTAAAYRENITKSVNENLKQSNVVYIWEEIINTSTVKEIPKKQFDYMYNNIRYEIESYAESMKMTYEEMIPMYMSYMMEVSTVKTDAELREYINESIKQDLAVYALIQAAQITVSDDEVEIFIADFIEQNEITREELLEQYSFEYIKQFMTVNKADEYLLENNTYVLKPAESEDAE